MQSQEFSKGVAGTIRRVAFVPARYGLRPDRIVRRLRRMISLADRWGLDATIPVTASALDRHPGIVTSLSGVDLAIHGYNHVSYADLTIEEQNADIAGAKAAFIRHGVQTTGFRAPYLRLHPATYAILRSNGFVYDSSLPDLFLPESDPAYQSVSSLSGMRYANFRSLTRRADAATASLIEFPVALPDDEILVDGLGIRRSSTLSRILGTMVEHAARSGRHLVLQIHPERFDFFSDALNLVLQKASDDGAWKASLAQASAWAISRGGQPGNWPNGSPYALSLTGDLDAVSLADFVARVWVD